MTMSEAQMRDAYHEAEQILRLDEKWQQIMPGERKPNFRRAAREILRRALGHQVHERQPELNIHSGLMHEHEPREAELIERTLKTGLYHPRVLHNFQHGEPASKDEKPKEYDMTPDPDLPDIDVFLHSHGTTIDYGYLPQQHPHAPRSRGSADERPPRINATERVRGGALKMFLWLKAKKMCVFL